MQVPLVCLWGLDQSGVYDARGLEHRCSADYTTVDAAAAGIIFKRKGNIFLSLRMAECESAGNLESHCRRWRRGYGGIGLCPG